MTSSSEEELEGPSSESTWRQEAWSKATARNAAAGERGKALGGKAHEFVRDEPRG